VIDEYGELVEVAALDGQAEGVGADDDVRGRTIGGDDGSGFEPLRR